MLGRIMLMFVFRFIWPYAAKGVGYCLRSWFVVVAVVLVVDL